MTSKLRVFLVGAALLAGAGAFAQATAPAATADLAKGKAFVDAKGMTLYTFDKDAAGKSACNGPCATNWPPLAAAASASPSGDWTVVTRDDGSKQWAYKAKPLYTFAKDTKAGDATGDGFLNGAWHVATPERVPWDATRGPAPAEPTPSPRAVARGLRPESG